MHVGVGIPASVPGVAGRQLLDWAVRAEQHRFSTLAVLDRLVYGNYESLVTLGAVAAVTTEIKLGATILIAPYRANAALLAKQIATVDGISGGRLTVGVSAGGREDDFAASAVPYAGRGAALDRTLADWEKIWSGELRGFAEPIGPRPLVRPPLLVGGHTDAAMRRAARHGTGWIAGGSSASAYRQLVERLLTVWQAHGRDGRPRLAALGYFALGPDAEQAARDYLGRYYAFLGPTAAERIAGKALTGAAAVRATVAEYSAAGCDELLLFPCSAGVEQLDLLAEALG
ncbi:LLM class flavin-dependent oxidoreductase [Paractinoplanes ferrugineus]|uniref:Monooxygenase n=1 Tax=Paractinoplanes ferrugineus TaxID=113564 RepID=A0A919J4F7_9ACTN|nr:LLM class flavin-dependent oxidoreductase [Actinoplanes ferrugineus]GIE13730.1 monooxygenase [Actinoplanes ferrugineus]